MADFDEDQEAGFFDQQKAKARAAVAGMGIRELASRMKDCQAALEEAKRRVTELNAWYDVIRFEAIPSKMDEEGIDHVTYDGIGRVGLTGDLFVSVKPGQKKGLFDWLKKRKLGSLVQPSINASTLKAFIKGRIKKGEELPQEYVNITPITRASITKPK